MTRRCALVTGVGPGTGSSIVRRFVEGGYDVAMIARNEQRLRQLEAETRHTKAFPVDVTDLAGFDQTIDRITTDFGPPEVVIHNAVGGVFGNFMQVDPMILLHNFQVNVMALLRPVNEAARLLSNLRDLAPEFAARSREIEEARRVPSDIGVTF